MTDETPPEEQVNHAHADIGIVTALPIEIGPFLSLLERQRSYTGGKFKFIGGVLGDKLKIVIVQKAVGFAKARKATQALIEAHTPEWVLSVGFGGALQREMQIADIVMADSIVDQHGHTLRVDLQMEADPKKRLHVGRLLTADQILLKVDDKLELGEKHDALSVDLETLAVAQICKETGTKFLAIRSISDDLSEDLPKEILSLMGESGSVRAGAVLGAMWNRFGSVKDMWHLREKAMTAARRLAKFLNSLLPRLMS
ncbi:MAG TPA: 5'-methylthioadenosine nucleosidase [Planctomycetaceae bacterium]|nr:5'-methylthioadenosine nucleosidase [Planctomycetaceae bacterium]